MIGRLALACALGTLVAASLGIAPLQVGYAQQVATSTPTSTPTGTLTLTLTPAPSSLTLIASATPTLAPIATATPSRVLSPLTTATPTAKASLGPLATPTLTPRPAATPVVQVPQSTAGPLFTPTPTRSPTRTPTPTLGVGATGSLVALQTPLATPGGPSAISLTPLLTPLSATTAAALAPPQATDLAVSSITRSSATITWTTAAPSTSQVAYGAPPSPLSSSPLDPSLVTAHSVVLTGLQPATTYQFHAVSATSGGAPATSPDNSFLTAPPGSGPDVTDPVVQQATGSLAHVGWSTSTGTVAQLEYGTSANYGSFTLLQVYSGPAQDMALTGLRPATLYHFRVKEWDAQGGLGASADATFATAPSGLANLVGDDTVQTDHLTLSGGQAAAYQYYAAQSGLASVAHVYVDAGSSTPTLRVALYSDLNGTPGSILSQGSASSVAPGWISVNISPIALLAGNRYWVALLNPLGSGVVNLRQSASGGSSLSGAQTSLAAFPQPFTGGIPAAHSPLSMYVQQVPPAVTLTAPTDGSVVNGQAQITAVVDDDAPVSRVQFYVDGQPVGAPVSAAPYAFAWDSTGLSPALPHAISARATDALGRSGVSSNVNVQVDNGPAISNVSAGPGLTESSARVTWTTDVAADGQVEYGDSTAYGLTTPVNPVTGLRHDMQLTGLSPRAVYHYRVRSRDAAGAMSVSPDATLATSPPSDGS